MSTAELGYLVSDLRRIVNGQSRRWLLVPFSHAAWMVAWYRVMRCLYLACGAAWPLVQLAVAPVAVLLSPWTGELDYRASIGPGLLILHPSAGVVVNATARIGENCVLAGGNFVGGRGVVIGDDVSLGANAVVMAPARVASGSRVGAGAVVVSDFGDQPGTLVGVPAHMVG